MSTTALSVLYPTLLDQIKRTDPNGAIANVIEVLTQRNPMLQDMMFKEGNLPTGHRVTSRTALPSVSWRRLNEGINSSKSATDQVDETCGLLEGMSVVDVDQARLNGNEAAFRASEDKSFLQAMNNEVETGAFYHSTLTAPEKFMGLSGRFASTTATGGSQIIKHDASGSGADQTSMWLICWGDGAYGIYPKGSMAGMEAIDMGKQVWSDSNSKKYLAYVTNWKWKIGLCVQDFRQVVRIANIDTGNLVATGSTLVQSAIKAYHQIYDRKLGRLAWYCNRTVGTYLHLQAMDSVKNSTLSIKEIGGEPVTTLLGIPVRETDALTNTESAVS